MTTKPLRILIVEDNPLDAELVLRELRKAGYDPAWKRVETEEDYLEHLAPDLDLVLADFVMPKFSGMQALALLKESGLDVPFIIVSGTIGEDQAVEVMKYGAADYLIKDRLSRLGQAVGAAMEKRFAQRRRLEAERALLENASFIDDILNSLTAQVVVVDESGRITAANEAWKRVSREQNGSDDLGQNYLEACASSAQRFCDCDAAAAAQGIRSVLERGTESFTMEYPCGSPGDPRWFHMRVSPMRGTKRGVVISREEITERKLAEKSLRLFRTLVDHSIDTIEVVDPITARFLDVNESGCDALGYSREEYLALRVFDVDPMVSEAAWPRIRQEIRDAGLLNREGLHRRKDGSAFPVELSAKWVRLDGQDYIVATVRDISDRKKAEKELKESEARYQTLFECAPDGIVVADSGARYLDANAKMCRMVGYTRAELVGMLATEIIAPAPVAIFEAGLADFKAASSYHGELHFVRKDGSILETEIIASTMPDGSLLGMVRDISERKRAEAELREVEKDKESAFRANRLKSEFLANMSHELRTPLNAILGFTEMVIDGIAGPLNPKQKEYLTDAHNSAQHLLQLVNDILDLAKVEAGKLALNPQTFSPAVAVENIRAVVYGLANKGRVALKCKVSEEVGKLELDLPKFKQICYNLLSNAIKFTDPGGSVTLDLTPQGDDRFELRVTDTGIGIKKEDLPRLFHEFEQIEGGIARRFEGTGLGLALTKKLVEAQGGKIRVESEFKRGSAFTVNLPRRSPR